MINNYQHSLIFVTSTSILFGGNRPKNLCYKPSTSSTVVKTFTNYVARKEIYCEKKE